jgi:type II secretory pathway component PulF
VATTAIQRPLNQRVNLLRQLATLLRAGVDLGQALHSIGVSRTVVERPGLAQLVQLGLLRADDVTLLSAMQEAGRLDVGLDWLAGRLERERQQHAQLKARFAMPLLVLLLAIFLAPLPAAIGGQLSLFAYVLNVVKSLLLSAGLIGLGVWLFRTVSRRWTGPTLGRRAQRLQWLADLLAAGLDAQRALQAMARRSPPAQRAALLAAARDCASGHALVESLLRHQLILADSDYPMLSSAEQAGRLAPGMAHYAEQLHEQHQSKLAFWLAWLPRLFYFAVLAFMAWSILGSGLGLPSVEVPGV